MNLVIVEPGEVDAAGTILLTDARARHLRDVLNVTRGQTVRIGLLDGPLGIGVVADSGAEGLRVQCTFAGDVPDRPRVDLMLAVPRPKVLRRLWAQIAALGVGRIILTNAERVERQYFDTHILDAAVYRPLLIEGLQQARDTRLPVVSVHRRFRVLIEDELDGLSGDAARYVADPGSTLRLADAVRDHAGGRVLMAVGPEGGWNQFELDLLQAHGFTAVAMGARTLRVDTACIALLAGIDLMKERSTGQVR